MPKRTYDISVIIRLLFLSVLTTYVLGCSSVPIPLLTRAAIEVANQPQPQLFLDGTEDIPLYRGLKPFGADPLVYDAVTGRVVNATYVALETSPAVIENFYVLTLPQLGWKKDTSGHYIRDEEKLVIRFSKESDGVFIHFMLTPIKK